MARHSHRHCSPKSNRTAVLSKRHYFRLYRTLNTWRAPLQRTMASTYWHDHSPTHSVHSCSQHEVYHTNSIGARHQLSHTLLSSHCDRHKLRTHLLRYLSARLATMNHDRWVMRVLILLNESALNHLSKKKQVGSGLPSCGPTTVALVIGRAKTPAQTEFICGNISVRANDR
jgi:hypothetical protein